MLTLLTWNELSGFEPKKPYRFTDLNKIIKHMLFEHVDEYISAIFLGNLLWKNNHS